VVGGLQVYNMDEMTKILKDMDTTYDAEKIYADEQRDLEENEEWYESMTHVDKPEFLKREHAAKESKRQGISIDSNLKPLKDMVIVAMKKEEVQKSGIIIARSRKQPDSNEGTVIALHDDSEYDFKLKDKVIIDLRKVKGRYNNKGIHSVIHKDYILGVIYG